MSAAAADPSAGISAPTSAVRRWLPSARAVIWLCLAAQTAIAGAIMADDAWNWAMWLGRNGIERVTTQPVSPGDQTRPFAPVTIPAHGPALGPGHVDSPVVLPPTLPRGLTFSVQQTDEYGPVLLIAGSIEEGDAHRFNAEIADMADPPKTIALYSPGGRVREAQRIGRTIRAHRMNTLIVPDAACLSSCPYILAGGVERTVSRTGWVGVHQHFHDRKTVLPAFLAVQGIQDGQGDTLEYLGEMGIDPLIMVHALKTPPDDIYLLVEKELLDYRLATRVVD